MAHRNASSASAAALVFGIIAIALSFLAYVKRIKVEDVSVTTDGACVYPISPACILGISAAVFLLIEQIVISGGTGCFCCAGVSCPSSCSGITSLVLFVFSWISFVISFMGLIYTAILNNRSYLTNAFPNNNSDNCPVGRDNLFLGGAIWCIITLALGLTSSVIVACGYNRHSNQRGANFANEQGVPLGQSQSQMKGKQARGQY